MGCSQSKPTDVSTPHANAPVIKEEETVEHQTKELTSEAEELTKQDEQEPMDETPKILEPMTPVIDTEPMPDSSAVDVPDSVRANFSSFNISFIDPTVSAPTSATTEPNVASTRVAVISEKTSFSDKDETLAVKEEEPAVNWKTEELAAEQSEDAMKLEELVEEPAATTEEHVAAIERVEEPVVEPLASVLKDETLVEEQIEIKVEEAEAASVGIVATAKEHVAAGAETLSATAAIKETTEGGDELVKENNVAQSVDDDKVAEPVVEIVADPVKGEKAAEPVKDENKVAKSTVGKVGEDFVQKIAEPAVDESSADLVQEKTDATSVKPSEDTTVGEIAVPAEEPDVVGKAVAAVKEPATVIEDPVTSNQTENVATTVPTVGNKSDDSAISEDSIEAEDSGVERPDIADKPPSASISETKVAAEL